MYVIIFIDPICVMRDLLLHLNVSLYVYLFKTYYLRSTLKATDMLNKWSIIQSYVVFLLLLRVACRQVDMHDSLNKI